MEDGREPPRTPTGGREGEGARGGGGPQPWGARGVHARGQYMQRGRLGLGDCASCFVARSRDGERSLHDLDMLRSDMVNFELT